MEKSSFSDIGLLSCDAIPLDTIAFAKLLPSIRTLIYSIIKTNEMHYFSSLFGKELFMFRTDLLSIVRSLNTVFTATGICYTDYVGCLLARSILNSLADRMTNTNCCECRSPRCLEINLFIVAECIFHTMNIYFASIISEPDSLSLNPSVIHLF